jgi:hypothetical protein
LIFIKQTTHNILSTYVKPIMSNKEKTLPLATKGTNKEKPCLEYDSDDNPLESFKYVTRMLSFAASPLKPEDEFMSRPAFPSFEATRMMTSPARPIESRPIESRPKTGLTYASFPVKFTFMKGTEWYPITNTRGWYCDKCQKYPSSGRRFACGDPTKDLDLCEDCVITMAPEETIEAITEEMESLKRMFMKAQDVITTRHAKKDAELVETMSSIFITGTEAVKPDSTE